MTGRRPVACPARPCPRRFARLAGWPFRHRWAALLAWIAVLAAVSGAGGSVGADYHNDFSLPGTESQRALDALRRHGAPDAGATVQVVVADRRGLRAPGARSRVERLLTALRGLPHVRGVRGPYGRPGAVSGDGTIGYATVTLDAQAQDVPTAAVRRIVDTAQAAAGAGLRVELGGEAVVNAERAGGGPAEGVGLLAALVVLVLLFGSLLAAALPIVVAIFAVGTAIGLVVLASHVVTVADFTTPLMTLVGLGVGIDYALLLFSRFRDSLRDGADRQQALDSAVDTAGRTVLCAGSTVIIALLGLIALDLGSLQGAAVAVAATVLVTMLAALSLLPALLALAGGRIERSVRRRAGRGLRARARWARWAALVQRRPWPAGLLGLALLLALCVPALGMRLGIADAGNGAPSRTSRQAYDLLAKGFGPGFNGPLIIVAEGDPQAARAARGVLAHTRGIAAVTAPIPSPDRQIATLIAYPSSEPQAASTQRLVARLREQVLPRLHAAGGATLLVGGPTAAAVDFSAAIAGRLVWFILAVVGLSALVLLVVFRSLAILLKAAVLNLLSVGAALGALTLVFQHGVLGGLLGVQAGPVEAFVPVTIFAIAFGPSMDYELFLLARMHEHWQRHRDAAAAIRDGITTTGRIVTAAAAIMIVVFVSFLLDPTRTLKQFGFGLAVAVAVDALIVRSLMVPAVMQLLGARAWWLPAPLARRLPHVALEHPAGAAPPPGTRRPATATAEAADA